MAFCIADCKRAFRKGIMGDRELPQVIAGWKAKLRAKKAAKQEVTSK